MQKAINGFYVYVYHHDDDPRGGWVPLEKLSHLTPTARLGLRAGTR